MTMPTTLRQVLRFDCDWRFHAGDIDAPLPNKHIAAYMANKAGYARGAAKPNYDDSDWRTVELPHDWSVEGKFGPSNHMDAGFLPRGIGWYRRRFRLEESDRGKYLAIRFDGIASHCTVYVNGHRLHRHFCGYTPFTVDISDVATFGDELNVIAVRVDGTYMEGWWYEGAGIYRHAWLIKTSPLHVASDGILVRPQRQSSGEWDTWIDVQVENRSDDVIHCDVINEIVDPEGKTVVKSHQPIELRPRSAGLRRDSLPLTKPVLWSPQSPTLYELRTKLRVDDLIVDEVVTRFGYRTIRFDPNDGFFLNDEPIKL